MIASPCDDAVAAKADHAPVADGLIAAYRNNPFCEAFGPVPDEDQTLEMFSEGSAEFDPADRNLPPHLRAHAACALLRVWIPTREQVQVAMAFRLMQMQGYLHRNILCPQYRRRLIEDRPILEQGEMPRERFARIPLLGGGLIGHAGCGKTATLEIIESNQPRVFRFKLRIDGVLVAVTQVPILRLVMFENADLKALAVEFFRVLGELVGITDLGKRWGVDSCTPRTAQPLIYKACREYHIGIIVVDEVQNMASHYAGYREVLSYFVRLMNTCGVPVLIVGTPMVSDLLQTDLSPGRRFIGVPIPPFRPFRKGSKMLLEFLKGIWGFRYVDTPSDPEELADVVHDITGGVPDLIIKLNLLSQHRLFGRKVQKITDTVLNETAAELFTTVQDRLLELKGEKKESDPHIGKVKERLQREFEKRVNAECARNGAAPVFPDAPPPAAIEVNSPEKKSGEGNEPAGTDVATPPPKVDHPIVAAWRSGNFKAEMRRLGLLEER